ncbi:hypothetical protein M6D81_17415 [Paenibacillus sp. J5C_2022]|uniref:hypothetical protein n=1 Tax=Paenibacillus sp. J5C2022 TaxID=2977129 RepID=UPI0021D17238|nr:hypothetical protein [Paenibacillus sp. J5C2022]MCU6710475.1 hypothetical protein [Paenibacillus sp. J5C2022]
MMRNSGDLRGDLLQLDVQMLVTAPELKRRQLYAGISMTMIGYGEMLWERASSSGGWVS